MRNVPGKGEGEKDDRSAKKTTFSDPQKNSMQKNSMQKNTGVPRACGQKRPARSPGRQAVTRLQRPRCAPLACRAIATLPRHTLPASRREALPGRQPGARPGPARAPAHWSPPPRRPAPRSASRRSRETGTARTCPRPCCPPSATAPGTRAA